MMQPPPQKGLFNQPPQSAMNVDLGSLQTRLRLTEEKSTNLNGKIELLENNFVTSNKKRNEALRELQSDALELKREVEDMKQKLLLIIRELKLTAGKDELNT